MARLWEYAELFNPGGDDEEESDFGNLDEDEDEYEGEDEWDDEEEELLRPVDEIEEQDRHQRLLDAF